MTALYIVKAKKTFLKSPLSTTATSVILDELIDSQGNDIAMASFGEFGVVVLTQATTVEMIKFTNLSRNVTTGAVTLTVATNGRDISPVTPYAGSSTGQRFNATADAIITNDPLTMMKFGLLNNANLWDLLQIFSVVPETTGGNATTANQLIRKAQLDSAILGIVTSVSIVVDGTAGETITDGQLVYLKQTDNQWFLADADTASTVENVILGIAQGAGTAGNPITNGVMLRGVDDAQTGLTAGVKYYASNTAGGISSSAGTKEVTVGIAKSTTSIYFEPRFDQMLTEDQQDAMDNATSPSATNPFLTGSALVGIVSPYVGSSAPTGWLLCDGSAVSRTTYASLFAIAGTTYGVGDGSTTFNLPDLRSRSIVGKGTGTKVATFASRSSNVITVTGLTNASNNEFQTGQAVLYSAPSGAMTGLTHNTTYYIVRVTNTTFSLATSLTNAQNGTVISLSSDGTGAQTFTLTLTARTLGDTGGEETHAMSITELLAHTHTLNHGSSSGGGSGMVTNGNAPDNQSNKTSYSTGGNVAMNNMQPFLALNYIVKY